MKLLRHPGPRDRRPTATVIVPFHRNLDFLDRCLAALARRPAGVDVLVASDGAPVSCEAVARHYGARVCGLAESHGPAVARNRAASMATGEILIFVDADVVVAAGAVEAMLARFAVEPSVAAVFGSYDDDPAAPGFFSQYKNLAHAFVHRAAAGDVASFWAGFGGIRAKVFRDVGGFDEGYARPCIEDIELGLRLASGGHRIVIDPALRACHLKRWSFVSMVRSDVCDRGIPWTRLILQSRRLPSSLNVDRRARASVVLSWAAVIAAALSLVDVRWLGVSVAALLATLWMNRALYAFLSERRGTPFALGGAAAHLLYHFYNGVSLAIGVASHLVTPARDGADERTVSSSHAPRGTS